MKMRVFWPVVFIVAAVPCRAVAKDGGAVGMSNSVKAGSYAMASNGTYILITNVAELWPGTWKDSTNGWRIQLYVWPTNSLDPWLSVAVGSVLTNSGGGFFADPRGKFIKFELRDSSGSVLPARKGMSMEGDIPSLRPTREFPKWQDGAFQNPVGFFSNSPPSLLMKQGIRDIYRIEREGDYVLTVCPAIYRYLNTQYMRRVDLPCVTTKIHLTPSPQEK